MRFLALDLPLADDELSSFDSNLADDDGEGGSFLIVKIMSSLRVSTPSFEESGWTI